MKKICRTIQVILLAFLLLFQVNALQYDGSASYVDCGDPVSGALDFGAADLSIVFWAKTAAVPNYIMAKGATANHVPGYALRVISDRQYIVLCDGVKRYHFYSSGAAATMFDGNWHHHAWTTDHSGANVVVKYYLGGVSKTVAVASGAMASNLSIDATFDLAFGGFTGGGALSNIQLAEVAFLKKLLTQNEINFYKNRKLTGGEPGLVGYWPMDDSGTGTSVSIKDLSGGRNPGTMNSFAGNPWRGGPPIQLWGLP